MKSYMIISVVNSLYEKLVHRNKAFSHNEGILFKCTIRAECLGYEKDGNTHHKEWEGLSIKKVYMLLLKGHQVFTNVITNKKQPKFGFPQTGWKNTSNHDSCWRSGCDELTYLGFNAWDEAFTNYPKKDWPETKDSEIHFSLHHDLLGPIFKFVEVTKEPDYEVDSTGYHQKITSIKEITKTLTI